MKMKKIFLWLLIVSMIAVFTLAGCKGQSAEEAVATEAVVATEAAIVDLSTQALVDTVTGLYNKANGLVAALPEGAVKVDLTARLVVVQDAIEKAGPKIAFYSDRDGNYEIYIMNVDGSEQVRLTNNMAGDFAPYFSP
jgi:hypothetical protein